MKKLLLSIAIPVLALQMTNAQPEPDSTVQTIYAWKLSNEFTEQINYPVDTIFYQSQIFNANFKSFPFKAYLGNLGSPALSNNYLERIAEPAVPFLNPYKHYLHLPENQIYFNTKKPFTDLNYTTGKGKQKNEQTLSITHTQNINEDFNVGINFDLISSDGRYSNQKTGLNSISLFSSYVLDRYSMHATFNRNSISVRENGGIIDNEDLKDTKTEDIPVNLGTLNNAESELRNLNFLLTQSFTLGKNQNTDSLAMKQEQKKELNLLGTFTYIFEYQKNYRIYFDENPRSGFYRNIYLDSLSTSDSVQYRLVSNTLQFDFQSNPERKFRFGGWIGIRSELEKFSTIIPTDTLVTIYPPDVYTQPGLEVWINNNDTTFKRVKDEPNSNLALSFQLFNDLGDKFNWKAWGKYYLSGYKIGDFTLQGLLNKSFTGTKGTSELILHGKLKNYRPGYWNKNFYSNHFTWENNLQNVTETTIRAEYNHPLRKLKATASYTLLDQFLFFDSLALPSQSDKILSVFGLSLEKDITLGRWHFLNYLIFQQSDKNDVLPLPALLLQQTTYFQHNFHFDLTNGDLLTQWGFDLFYHTPYSGYAYMPAIGQYHIQEEEEIGNYPFLDVFLNVKLKRTRFFLKYEHVASGLLGENYFTVLHYPMNQRVFKFGLSWTFYD